MSRPRISCVVPVHDGEAYLTEAIDSILAQTYRPIEVVVVDDGSTDRSREIALGYGPPVRVIERSACGGTAVARAAGAAAARGRLICFLDHDDLWHPRKLEHQFSHLEGPPRLDVSFCAIENFWEDELERERELWTSAGRLRGTYLMTTALIRRSVLTRVPLDTSRRHFDKVVWIQGLRSAGVAVGVLPDVLVHRRRHMTNATRTHMNEVYEELFAILHERVRSSRGG
jgi:glycosyltransferase involved in cell wall biosynthesis